MERVFGAGHPDPVEIERAKKLLKVKFTCQIKKKNLVSKVFSQIDQET